jgi:uracil-DNA glycosylase
MKRGPLNAPILILGEAPGQNEVAAGVPFVGKSGQELSKMLHEAGIDESQCLFANVCNERPEKNDIENWMPKTKKDALACGAEWHKGKWCTTQILRGLDTLDETIAAMPNLRLVITLGNVPLWALTNNWGITKWRGSQIKLPNFAVVPTYHPAAIMRQWEWRWIAVEDFKRAKSWLDCNFEVPPYEFIVRPSHTTALSFLNDLLAEADRSPTRVAVDIETRSRHIACIGFGVSPLRAICIPFMTLAGPYFGESEEISIVYAIYKLLTHPNIEVIGQNYLYDRQYLARRWGFRSRLVHDTMVKHHLCFPGVSKGLDFLSSLYCKFHLYWKDESKDWDPKVGEEQLWVYNCKDAVTTFEANEQLEKTVRAFCL